MIWPESGTWRNRSSVDSLGNSSISEDCSSRKAAKLAKDSGIKSLLVFFYLPNAQSEPQKWLALGVLIGERAVTALNRGSIV